MTPQVQHMQAHTYHGRKGDVENGFRYSVDYILLEPENQQTRPALFSRNRFNLMSWSDRDHGGEPGNGAGADWVRRVHEEFQMPQPGRIALLTHARVLGHVFNPVSFWLCFDSDDNMISVIAEVTNTYGDRQSYVCHKPDFSPINPQDRIAAEKHLHVSPFQPRTGQYVFRFDIRDDRIGIWIDYGREAGGLIATLTGPLKPLTNRAIAWAALRRPLGARRMLALIHWQALKLWWKGARFRNRPEPELHKVSRG